jgi:hypothetical protein
MLGAAPAGLKAVADPPEHDASDTAAAQAARAAVENEMLLTFKDLQSNERQRPLHTSTAIRAGRRGGQKAAPLVKKSAQAATR